MEEMEETIPLKNFLKIAFLPSVIQIKELCFDLRVLKMCTMIYFGVI